MISFKEIPNGEGSESVLWAVRVWEAETAYLCFGLMLEDATCVYGLHNAPTVPQQSAMLIE